MLLTLLSSSASAVDCQGKVTLLGYDVDWANPTLLVSLEGGPTAIRICGLTEKYNGVVPAVCKILHSELLAAKMASREVMFRFPEHSSCKSIPSLKPAKVGWHTFQ